MRIQLPIKNRILPNPQRRDDPPPQKRLETKQKSPRMEITKIRRTTEEKEAPARQKKERSFYFRCLIYYIVHLHLPSTNYL